MSRREGGKVFGSGSRAPVAITILVKNPNAEHDGCRIHYRDIGDYLKQEEKLDILREAEVDFRSYVIGRRLHLINITIGLDNATLYTPGSTHLDRRTRRLALLTMRYLDCIRKACNQPETRTSIIFHAILAPRTRSE